MLLTLLSGPATGVDLHEQPWPWGFGGSGRRCSWGQFARHPPLRTAISCTSGEGCESSWGIRLLSGAGTGASSAARPACSPEPAVTGLWEAGACDSVSLGGATLPAQAGAGQARGLLSAPPPLESRHRSRSWPVTEGAGGSQPRVGRAQGESRPGGAHFGGPFRRHLGKQTQKPCLKCVATCRAQLWAGRTGRDPDVGWAWSAPLCPKGGGRLGQWLQPTPGRPGSATEIPSDLGQVLSAASASCCGPVTPAWRSLPPPPAMVASTPARHVLLPSLVSAWCQALSQGVLEGTGGGGAPGHPPALHHLAPAASPDQPGGALSPQSRESCVTWWPCLGVNPSRDRAGTWALPLPPGTALVMSLHL